MNKLLILVPVLLLAIIAECHAGRRIAGYVRTVYDGDTILLATRENVRMKVRLYGIDAPETAKPGIPGQPFSDVAKRTLMYKILGREVSAEIIETDQYQRSVAVIRYAGRDINREMVAEGMAWAYRQYLQGPYASEYIGVEAAARGRRKGLWQEHNPLPPWEFRQAMNGKPRHRRR